MQSGSKREPCVRLQPRLALCHGESAVEQHHRGHATNVPAPTSPSETCDAGRLAAVVHPPTSTLLTKPAAHSSALAPPSPPPPTYM